MAGLSRESTVDSRTPSQLDLAAERIWWSEAMTLTIQKLLAEQTRQLQACIAEEAQKQQAVTAQVQRLLAEHTRQLKGCVAEEAQEQARQPQGSVAARAPGGGAAEGRLEELLEQEMEDRRRGEAGLREMISQYGGALARIEAFFQPLGGTDEPGTPLNVEAIVEESDKLPPAIQTGTGTQSTFGMGVVDLGSPLSYRDRGHSLRSCCKAICHSRRFVVCTAIVIAANSVYLGFEANAIMTSSDFTMPDHVEWRLANAFFASAFLVELTLRWVADGATFLSHRNPEFLWNWLDSLLILITVVEEFLRYCSVDVITFGFLRLTRLLRVTRMMRAFKAVRELKELKIMITGLLNCARPLFWAGVLLLSWTYMMAVLTAQLLTEYLRSVQDKDLDAENMHAMHYIAGNFSNLWESMYSLFEALTGGRDWGEIARPFRQIHGILVICLVLYVVVGVFCILNLLTAVFIEAAHRLDDVQELVYAKRDWVNATREFFLHAIEDVPVTRARSHGSNCSAELKPRITRDSFVKLLSDKQNLKFLEANGVDLFFMGDSRLKELFSIMDEDDNGDLDVNEFVDSLYRLKGAARSLDLKLEHQRISHMINSLREGFESMQLTRNDPTVLSSTSLRRARTSSRAHATSLVGPAAAAAAKDFPIA